MNRAALSSAVVVVAALSFAREARAVDTVAGAPPGEAQPPETSMEDRLVDRAMRRGWAAGPPRTFLALTLDAGYLYFRPRASLGWGKPFTSWFGVDANPVVSGNGWGAYGGVRLAIPSFDLRVGPRYFRAFQHAYMQPKDTIGRLDLDNAEQARASMITYEAELTGSVPVGPGDVLLLGSGSYVDGVPEGLYVFEETLRVVVKPPLVWRVRGGYQLRLGSSSQHSVGLVADVLDVPARDDSITVRTGPIMRVVLSRHFEVRGSFVVTVSSPDRLGLVGGDFTELGVRYRFTTE
jgi:hypothetical protein